MADAEKPKYQKLKEYIIETITSEKLKPDEKIYSENELSEKFGISRHTVRQAIGELVSEGWLYRVQGKGTFVNRVEHNNENKMKTIGVITTYLNDYIFPAIIRGIDSVLSINGYNIILSCTYNQHERERLCLQNFSNQNIDGLIVEPTRSALPNPNLDLYEKFNEAGMPVMFIHGAYRNLECSYIVEDDVKAGFIATKHLIELGHTNIGGLFKMDDIQGHQRFQGFQQAHLEHGLGISDSRVIWFDTEGYDIELRYKESNRLESLLSECSAIVCYNDQIAVKIMDIIRDKGLNIPENISIVSFDDSQLAVASEVKITTVAHPKEKLGEEAANAMINMIDGTKNNYNVKMEPELIIRGSTRRI